MKDMVVSFSGGRTSAYMARKIQLNPIAEKQHFVFMNTGAEHEETLDFVNKCDKEFGLNLVWLEADISPEKGKGTKHKIVSYETASRKSEPFYAMVKKYGVPNKSYPHCNRELKLQVFNSWMAENCPSAYRAIGIRVDEIDRMAANMDAMKIIYPLIRWSVNKGDVLGWWSRQSFDLNIPEHYGNCITCWKKSDKKLLTIALNDPKQFDHFKKMELIASDLGSNAPNNSGVFFRKHRSTKDILKEARSDFEQFSDKYYSHRNNDLNACSESCDLFGD